MQCPILLSATIMLTVSLRFFFLRTTILLKVSIFRLASPKLPNAFCEIAY